MPYYTRTSRAEDDLLDITIYIAADNAAAADRFLDRVDAVCQTLAHHPLLGRVRPDLGLDVRMFPVGRYLVLYRPIPDGIEVLRVVHGARYLPGLL